MTEMPKNTFELRQRVAELLPSIEDRQLLAHVVELLSQSYMEEVVEYEQEKPVSRKAFLEVMERAHSSIERGEGVSDMDIEAWINNLPEND